MLSSLSSSFAYSAPRLASWESHGQIADAAAKAIPALDNKLISEVNAANGGWKAGRNSRFEGATLLDAKKLMGTLQNTQPTALPAREYTPSKVGDLPTDFDWRTDDRAAKCPTVKEVRDQANCGSCWAFGSVEALNDRFCIQSKGANTAHLSAQDLTACCGIAHGDMGCNGGIPESAYAYMKGTGVVTGGNYGDKSMCWSYQLAPCAHHTNSSKYGPCPDATNIGKCAKKCVDNGADWAGDKKKSSATVTVCQQGMDNSACADAMAQEIYTNGPITGMFFVHQSFTSYKSGVYSVTNPLKDPMLGGHAIKIMGFGVEDGTPYWLVANSWNEDWGMDGFFKIKRGNNECQIEDPVINGGPVAGTPAL